MKPEWKEAWDKGASIGKDMGTRREIIADRLKLLRLQKGWKQREFAQRIIVNPTTYGGYETAFSKPTIDVLVRIADAYGVSLDYLTGRTDNLYGIGFPEEKSEPDQKSLETRITEIEKTIADIKKSIK